MNARKCGFILLVSTVVFPGLYLYAEEPAAKQVGKPLPYQSEGVTGYAVTSGKPAFSGEDPCVAVGQCDPGQYERSSVEFGHPSTEFFEVVLDSTLEFSGIHYSDIGTIFPESGVNPTVEYWDGSKYLPVVNPSLDGPGPNKYGEHWHFFDVVASTRIRLKKTGHGNFWYLQRFQLLEGKVERTGGQKKKRLVGSAKVKGPAQLPYQSAGVIGHAVASNAGLPAEEPCVAVGQCEPGEHLRTSIAFGQPSTEFFEVVLVEDLEVSGIQYTDVGSIFPESGSNPTVEYWDGSQYVLVKNPVIEGPGPSRYGTHYHFFDSVSSTRFRLSKTAKGNYWYIQRLRLLETGVAQDAPSAQATNTVSASESATPPSADAPPAFRPVGVIGALPYQSPGITGFGSMSRLAAAPGEGACVALGQCPSGAKARSSVAFGSPSTEYFKIVLDKPVLVSGIRYSDKGSVFPEAGVRPRVEYWNGSGFVEVSNPVLEGPGPNLAGDHSHLFEPVSSRYFRLLKTGNGGYWYLQRIELIEAAKEKNEK